jgi:ribonuclease VapC
MVVDSSAIVAMMLGDAGADALADRLEQAPRRLTHPLAVYEATAALAHVKRRSVLLAYQDVAEFLTAAEVELLALGQAETIAAIEAFSRFGRGQGHPADLTMGGCFSYACAQLHGIPVLASGDGFARTDLA